MEQAQVFGLGIAAMVAGWVASDARRRGGSFWAAMQWGMGVFLLLAVFLPLYLFIRSKQRAVAGQAPTLCQYCGLNNAGNPFYCNHCSKQLRGVGGPPSAGNP